MLNKIKTVVRNTAYKYFDPRKYIGDQLPPKKLREILSIPMVRRAMVEFSVEEYKRNPYYKSVIDKRAEQTIGPCPTLIATSPETNANDQVEDSHKAWTEENSIGKALREYVRQGALTGLGLLIKTKLKRTSYPFSLGYRAYGANALQTPYDATPDRDWET